MHGRLMAKGYPQDAAAVRPAHIDVRPGTDGCEECLELGAKWAHLRMCLTCGHVGCCSSSKHDHALQHFRETGHPMTRPYRQPSLDWIWCYEDKALLDPR